MGRKIRLAMLMALPAFPLSAEPLLGLPIACPADAVCPIQQFVDLDPGPGARDPWCGSRTYDGHKGTDFRVLSMRDVERGVEVVAMADGVVKASRDGMADKLVLNERDRKLIGSRECGNGLILDHGGGLETQYCHMRQGSVRPVPGSRVRKGETLGLVGASGLAEFPHVHVTLRRNGEEFDPFTGLKPGQDCAAFSPGSDQGRWLDETAMAALGEPGLPVLLSAGFAAGPVGHRKLVDEGLPEPPDRTSKALVGYIWAINLAKGDRLRIRIEKDGQPFSAQTIDPLDRPKAVYVAFSGKKGSPEPGLYMMEAEILRDGNPILARKKQLELD